MKPIEIGVISPSWAGLPADIDLYGIIEDEINYYLEKLPTMGKKSTPLRRARIRYKTRKKMVKKVK